jgi:hypothetical protein
MGRLLLIASLLASSIGSAAAQGPKEKAAILGVELGKGVPDSLRVKTTSEMQQGLTAAGYDLVPTEQVKKLSGDLAACKSGKCLVQVGKALGASALVSASITRERDVQTITMQLADASSGDVVADVREVCERCGKDELDERLAIAVSTLRSKAGAQLAMRTNAATSAVPASAPAVPPVPSAQPGETLKVAVVPGIAVNLDTARVDALSQDLADALNSQLVVQAVGGLEVRRLLPSDGVPPDCVTTPACTADVARRTGASQLLFVVMVDTGAGGSIQVDTTWVDPAANQSASRPAIDLTSTSTSEARNKFETAAPTLLPDAPVRPKPTTGGTVVAPKMTEGVPRHVTTPATITAGVALVALGVGIGLGVKTRSKYEDCDRDPNHCTQNQRASIRNFGISADVGFIVATGATVATVILYLTSSEEPRWIATPTSDGGATVSAIGRF